MTTEPVRFGIRYLRLLRPLFAVLGAGPRSSAAALTRTEVRVAMGLQFRACIPLDAVVGATRARIPAFYGIGVHGWAGRWAVNGSLAGAVRLDIDPPLHARVCGVPVRLRTLWLSLTDPDGFLRALADARTRS